MIFSSKLGESLQGLTKKTIGDIHIGVEDNDFSEWFF
jgi:hypothetical protein